MATATRFRLDESTRATSSRAVDDLLEHTCFTLADPERAPDATHVLCRRIAYLDLTRRSSLYWR